jgi:5'-nucleotidase (lipoprotein e(P4) family)
MSSTFLASAAGLCAVLCIAQSAPAASIKYDCQAHMTRVETIPPVTDADPWQCTMPSAKTPSAVHWQRNTLEYCRMAVNVYDQALDAATRLSRKFGKHRWIVLMDADETVIDNSLFERERNRCGAEFKDAQWESWVRAGMARDVPGAAAFTDAVHKMGGLVGIVTNRRAADDAITQSTLKKAGIWFDAEIGMGDTSDKTARWRGIVVTLAKTFGGHPRALLWVGDQVSDLAVRDGRGAIVRAMTQQDSGDGIGTTLFLLPNPMYGGWSDNPDR